MRAFTRLTGPAAYAYQNGLLLIVLPQRSIDSMTSTRLESITIGLAAQTISTAGTGAIAFEVDVFRNHCLLNGLDEISLTERQEPHITAFERQREHHSPWIVPRPRSTGP